MNLKKLTTPELIAKLAETETNVSEMINFSVRLKYELQKRIVEDGTRSRPVIS